LVGGEYIYYNHLGDQHNVEIAKRLHTLQELVDPQLLQQGKYVLVNMGLAHTRGTKFYTEHEYWRKIKSATYAPTYNLVDSDNINLFTPQKEGWTKTILK